MVGNDTKISTFFSAGECQVYFVVLGNTVYKLVLKNVKAVTETDYDITPDLFVSLPEYSVRRKCRMFGRKCPESCIKLLHRCC